MILGQSTSIKSTLQISGIIIIFDDNGDNDDDYTFLKSSCHPDGPIFSSLHESLFLFIQVTVV